MEHSLVTLELMISSAITCVEDLVMSMEIKLQILIAHDQKIKRSGGGSVNRSICVLSGATVRFKKPRESRKLGSLWAASQIGKVLKILGADRCSPEAQLFGPMGS